MKAKHPGKPYSAGTLWRPEVEQSTGPVDSTENVHIQPDIQLTEDASEEKPDEKPQDKKADKKGTTGSAQKGPSRASSKHGKLPMKVQPKPYEKPKPPASESDSDEDMFEVCMSSTCYNESKFNTLTNLLNNVQHLKYSSFLCYFF